MYHETRDLQTVNKLYALCKAETVPTYFCMNYYLETAMRLEDNDKIIEAVRDLKDQSKQIFVNNHFLEREPKENLLKKLCTAVNMPDRVYVELYPIGKNYGFFRENVRRLMPKDKYLTM